MTTPTTIEATLVALIKGSTPMAALSKIWNVADIYPAFIPAGTNTAAISFLRMNTTRPSVMGVDTGLVEVLFQFSCWGRTTSNGAFTSLSDALSLTEGLRQTLERYRDTAGVNGVAIQDIFFDQQIQVYDETTQAHGVTCDFRVWMVEGS